MKKEIPKAGAILKNQMKALCVTSPRDTPVVLKSSDGKSIEMSVYQRGAVSPEVLGTEIKKLQTAFPARGDGFFNLQLKWIKLTKFVGEDFIKSPLNLMKDVHIPAYKLSDKVRMYQHDVKRWYGIMKEVFRRDNYTCQYCGAKGVKLEVDHIIPFSRGGSDDLSNLTTSCRRCNRQKKDKTIKEFLIWKEKNK